jgi:CRP-like cAMP-binding protein
MSPLPVQNLLLEELPARASKTIREACELVSLNSGHVLSEPGELIRDVYFPTECVVSLIAKVNGNACLEVALVGYEGMAGLPLLLGSDTEPLLAVVHISGEAWHMKAEAFKPMMERNLALRRALSQYAFVRLAQLAQNTACAKIHGLAARLARRLLALQDFTHGHQFHATQESLASMLGVRRSTLTLLAISFQRKRIIQYSRGVLTIVDRKALEALSCECYSFAPTARRAQKIR